MSDLTFYDLQNTVAGPFAAQEIATATIGPVFMGGLFNLLFYGFALSQLFVYLTSTRFPTDSIKIKVCVGSVMLLATMQSSFHFILIYQICTTQSRRLTDFSGQSVLSALDTLPVGIEGAIVQSYLVARASLLFTDKRKKIIFLTLSGFGIACGFVGAFLFMVLSFMKRAGTVERALPMTSDISLAIWLYSCAGVDLIVTGILVVTLKRHITGFRENTDGVLRNLIYLAISSASYTAVCATIPALLIVAIPRGSLMLSSAYAFPIPLSSFYAISLLHNLTSALKIRTKGDNDGYTTKGTAIHTWNGRNPQISIIPVALDTYELDSVRDEIKQEREPSI